MKHSAKIFFFFLFLVQTLHAERAKVDFSLVISGGVSLGAYEAGYNWALIKMLAKAKVTDAIIDPQMQSVAGASAGSINALLSAMYWCQKDSVPLHNSVDDNLFYETWVNLGIEDLAIHGKDPENKSSLFMQKGLQKKGDSIIEHLQKPIFKKNCEVPLGIAVTKVTPITKTIQGIDVKNQNFSVPLVFKEKNGQGIVENKTLPPSTKFYLSIPGIEKDRKKVINLLLASGAFPGAFQQIKLDYRYEGVNRSNYFIDGGLYDNVPLDLAIALNDNATHYFFMDPSNMRKEPVDTNKEEKEEALPVGFISTNLMPIFDSFGIMQSMKLYEAINQHFTGNSQKKLILSSRYHPLTGKFLGHFGAFLDQNFRVYDYYIGVYDAVYHLAAGLKRNFPQRFEKVSQIDIMNRLKTVLGIDENPEALAAYQLLLDTEFYDAKPKTTDRFSAIYNAFNTQKSDNERYDNDEFKLFLSKLDMHYLELPERSFVRYAKKDIDNWYKLPLRVIISRITTLENDRAEVVKEGNSLAAVTSLGAWAGNTFIKDKDGFKLLPLDVPQDEGKEGLRMALRLLPGEIATDLLNGGASFGYTGIFYGDMGLINGFEAKAAYVVSDKTNNFVRVDMDAFKEFDDLFKFGAGVSAFGDMESTFYQQDTAYGANAYVDIVDIFRLSYVYRHGSSVETENNYLYFGIENIPALIYWLSR
ncbi:MAG: patatin-like phospholipase family protein [Sulfurovum sp.]